MKSFARFKVFVLLLILLLSAAAISAQTPQTLTVFAAASLTDAFEEIATAFEAEHPGVTINFNFGGSSTLATQLVEGAPGDVFASANQRQMSVVIDAGLITVEP
ncbi:MAG: molybdate ABC transporter substrate-binding protein, partial [Anaerolineae bacterium]|nr:molybdate ABC transporter substrate-binding protein [Anaerolineae bacterium]